MPTTSVDREQSYHRISTSSVMASSDGVAKTLKERLDWHVDRCNHMITTPLPVRLDSGALRAALQALQERHPILCAKSGLAGRHTHANYQELHTINTDRPDHGLDFVKRAHQELCKPFDDTEPRWRAALFRDDKDQWLLSIVMHHEDFDRYSLRVLWHDFAKICRAIYHALNPFSYLEPLALGYEGDGIAGCRAQGIRASDTDQQVRYLAKELDGSRAAGLLIDKPRPASPRGQMAAYEFRIEGRTYHVLKDYCRTHQVTHSALLRAAFRAAHYRITGMEDSVIGTCISGRDQQRLQHQIGYFANTLCLRLPVLEEDTFGSLVHYAQGAFKTALEAEDVSSRKLRTASLSEERNGTHSDSPSLFFNVHDQVVIEAKMFGEVDGEAIFMPGLCAKLATDCDLEVNIHADVDHFEGVALYDVDLFTKDTIRGLIGVFLAILRHALESANIPVSCIPLQDDTCDVNSERRLEQQNCDSTRESSIVDIFTETAASCPDHVAIKDITMQLTYNQLHERSDHLARWLRRRGLAAETLIAVLAPRSCLATIAFLGILKANLAYVPLDVNAPAGRFETVLSSLPGQKRLVLLGADVQIPEMSLTKGSADFAWISAALVQPAEEVSPCDIEYPSASSLAYCMFTSGSTGKPKGVKIEHRGVVSMAKHNNFTIAKTAHLSNLAFDASIWEIFVPLLNGGTVVCIDYLTSLVPDSLCEVIKNERIQAVMITPGLLRQCQEVHPTMFRSLHSLYVVGDRFDPIDAVKISHDLDGTVFNAYGPTECTVISTIYEVQKQDSFPNGVPIGKAVSNARVHIMDPKQRRVPAGVLGEIVITGRGLARGYLDRALEAGRFIDIVIDGEQERGYRTGDRARYRLDGQLEMFGRMDRQTKVRGHRVELAEIESAILCNKQVSDVAVVRCEQSTPDSAAMVAFLVAHEDKSTGGTEHGEHISAWTEHYDSTTYSNLQDVELDSLGHDFVGWVSMLDEQPIPKTEMQEWLSDTIATITDMQEPGHVLEVGTGTGMILFNLRKGLRSYVGIEPSKRAAEFVEKAISSMPDLADRVKIHVGEASDLDGLTDIHPELVLLNSVVQYFPSQDYFTQTCTTLIHLPGVQRIVFGDIRTFALYRDFLASIAVYKLGNEARKSDVRQYIADKVDREEELLVDPAFFYVLQDRFPSVIEHVEILPKMMPATNELSAFRYTAVLHTRCPEEKARQIHEISESAWIDFRALGMTKDTLSHFLGTSSHAPIIAVRNIPHSKTVRERYLVEALDSQDPETNGEASWISTAADAARQCASMDALDLIEIGRRACYHAEVSCARQFSQRGGLDVVFHRQQSSCEGARVLFKFPSDHEISRRMTSSPLVLSQKSKIVSDVLTDLRNRLPSYMVPDRLHLRDRLPLNANGKVDRKELTNQALSLQQEQRTKHGPKTPCNKLQALLREEFEAVLGVQIDIDESFFDVGGHSLSAIRLAAKLTSRCNAKVTAKNIFASPTVRGLAQVLTDRLPDYEGRHISDDRHGSYQPFGLISTDVPDDFVDRELLPKVQHLETKVIDAYRPTYAQRLFLQAGKSGKSLGADTYYLDLPADVDRRLLEKSCRAIVERFDIFRTVFVRVSNGIYAVVLENGMVSISLQNTDGDLDDALASTWTTDSQSLTNAEPLLHIAIIAKPDVTVRLAFRMSHAIYDGLSLEHLTNTLHCLYTGLSLPPASSFTTYLQHAYSTRGLGREFWRTYLQSSTITSLRNDEESDDSEASYWAQHTIRVPRSMLINGITQATIFTTAYAQALAKETGSNEVLFGRLVSGRHDLPGDSTAIVGPCNAIVPIRIRLQPETDVSTLLNQVQTHCLDSLSFETIGLDDIVANCTDWPHDTQHLWSYVLYQDFSTQSMFAGKEVAWKNLPYRGPPIHELDVGGVVDQDSGDFTVFMYARRRSCSEEVVDRMLRSLCQSFLKMSGGGGEDHDIVAQPDYREKMF
ncbi:Nonribosomal peptide synthetase [Fulvia fulva]|nr:Nonribosomal peptide synthetase [Fulvia fulva]